MAKLYTIASISRDLSIPESTLRYRAKMFKSFLPVKGTGRKKRFLDPSLERFAFIDQCFSKGMSADDVRVELETKYDSELEVEVTMKSDARKEKSEKIGKKEMLTVDILAEMKEMIMPLIKVIENQEVIIQELKKQNQMLIEAPAKKKGFLRRLFR